MSRKWRATCLTACFLVSIPLLTVLAWSGDHFMLIALALTAAFLALLCGFLSYHWGETLDGWRSTLNQWGATTKYSEDQALIMRDAIIDLEEHDAEAAYIHSGRAHSAITEYAESFRKESDGKVTEEHGAPW